MGTSWQQINNHNITMSVSVAQSYVLVLVRVRVHVHVRVHVRINPSARRYLLAIALNRSTQSSIDATHLLSYIQVHVCVLVLSHT